MTTPKTAAFTLVEAVVAGAIFMMIAGVMIYVFTQSRGVEAGVSLQLGLLENVTLALHAIRTDLRHLCIVPGKPLDTYSFKELDQYHGLMLRVASPVPVNPAKVPGSHYTIVVWHLVPADHGQDRFHLERHEFTSSSTNLPGKSAAQDRKTFRAFTLKRGQTDFLYKKKDPAAGYDVEVLHVALDVVSDTGGGSVRDAFKEKNLVVTSVIRLRTPEVPYDPTTGWFWAKGVSPAYAPYAPLPPKDIRAPAAVLQELKPQDYGYPP